MTSWLKSFATDDCGAVTVDWVVLTAFLVGFVVAIFAAVESGTVAQAESISTAIEAITVGN